MNEGTTDLKNCICWNHMQYGNAIIWTDYSLEDQTPDKRMRMEQLGGAVVKVGQEEFIHLIKFVY